MHEHALAADGQPAVKQRKIQVVAHICPSGQAQISRKPGGLHGVHHAQDVQARHVRIGTLRVNLFAGVQHIRIVGNRGAAVVYRNQLRRKIPSKAIFYLYL